MTACPPTFAIIFARSDFPVSVSWSGAQPRLQRRPLFCVCSRISQTEHKMRRKVVFFPYRIRSLLGYFRRRHCACQPAASTSISRKKTISISVAKKTIFISEKTILIFSPPEKRFWFSDTSLVLWNGANKKGREEPRPANNIQIHSPYRMANTFRSTI